jgi:hypothetical protein
LKDSSLVSIYQNIFLQVLIVNKSFTYVHTMYRISWIALYKCI